VAELRIISQLLRKSRKTERGAKQFPIRMAVRAAPFALLRNSRKTERDGIVTSIELRATAPFAG
jgi:hypothetical protein